MNKFLLTVLLPLLTACSSTKYIEGDASKRFNFNKADKAYIVLGAENNATQRDFEVNNFFIFKSDKGKKVKLKVINGSTTAFMIDPGQYKLVHYSLYGEKYIANGKKYVDLDFSDSVKAAFSVRNNDIIYLGNINTKITKVNKKKIKKLFNFGINTRKEVEFETTIENNFDKLDKNKYKNDSDRKIESKILNWSKK